MIITPTGFNYLRAQSLAFAAGHRDDYTNFARPYFGITYIRCGHARYYTKTGNFSLDTGDILFTPYGSTYISEWSSASSVSMDTILFNMNRDVCTTAAPGMRRSYPVQAVRGLEHLGDRIRKAADAYKSFSKDTPPYDTLGWYAEVYAILGEVWQKIIYDEVPAPDLRLLPALRCIEENLSGSVTVETLAKCCYMSSSHFHACFVKEMGLPPIRYKLKRQVERAQLMLVMDVDKPVCDIARETGFESLSYFYRVFTGIARMPPGKYREVFGTMQK